MNIIIPVAGATPYFPADEFPFPKPLVEIHGRPMMAWAIDNLQTLEGADHFIFVTMRDEATKHSYEQVFSLLSSRRSTTVTLPGRTAGALCSCLMAIEHIDPDQPLLIANYDQVIHGELHDLIGRFKALEADAGVLTFDAIHPRWSYAKTDGHEVIEAAEKRVISRQAIAGIYWFARGSDFISAAMNAVRANDNLDGQYFITPSLNQLVLGGKRVVAVKMRQTSRMHSFFLPAGMHAFEQELQIDDLVGKSGDNSIVNVVIPAAGQGSRFANAGYTAPKPFIDVLGKPMLAHVIENTSVKNAHFTLLLREDHLGEFSGSILETKTSDVYIVPVRQLTEGTACTVLLARDRFDSQHPLLVANSDQLVDFSCQDFIDDARRRGLDGSILVFRDIHKDPKWSFASIDENGFVTEVAEKKAISEFATVGIYLFMNGTDFVRAAADMIANNDRVNNEFYTCPIYNYMIRNGAKIGIYEVDAAGMSGLGTPEDLEAYLARHGEPGTRSQHAPAG